MRTIRVGGIGCGYWGPNLFRNFIEIPEADFVAVADLQQERLDHIQTRYPQIRVATQNYRDLFTLGLDAIVISTPPHTHFAIARDCLEHGLHVLVEKPLTINSSDAREIIRVAEEHARVLMVGHTFEYNPAVRALKGMIDSGELGRIQYIDVVRVSLGMFQSHVNVVWDLAPHDISILLHLFGTAPHYVRAYGTACVQQGVEDIVYMNMVFPDNVMAHSRMSWLDPKKKRCITVVGTKKMVIYDDVESNEKIQIYNKGVTAIRRTDTFGDFQFAYHYGDVVIPHLHLQEPLRLECLHFLECIRERKPPLTDGYNGLQVVDIVEAAQASLREGGVLVPITNQMLSREVEG